MSDDAQAKQLLRSRLRAARRRRTAQQRAADAQSLRALATTCDVETIAAFVPTADEPGDRGVLDTLASTRRVLLPVADDSDPMLRWGWYDGPQSLAPGPWGLWQPEQASDADLGAAQLVLVPALAVTPSGDRLGQGGGFYDRALIGIPPERLAGVVHDDEVLPDLPTEPHDITVGWVCTPAGMRPAAA